MCFTIVKKVHRWLTFVDGVLAMLPRASSSAPWQRPCVGLGGVEVLGAINGPCNAIRRLVISDDQSKPVDS